MMSPAADLLEYLLRPLAPWLEDPATEDVSINAPGEAWVHRKGAWMCRAVPLTREAMEDIAILSGSLRRQEVGTAAPLCSTELPSGDRMQVCLPSAVPIGTVSLTIRKHETHVVPLSGVKDRYCLGGWNEWRGTNDGRNLEAPLACYDAGDFEGFLAAATRARLNILFAGPTGSGKTTIAKSVLAAIDRTERLITIEDTEELAGLPPNHVRLLYSKDGLSGGAAGPNELLQATLRMRPDRVILGELRDDAAWAWATQICTGHPGAVTTLHGRTAADAFRRLYQLAKSSPRGQALDDRSLVQMLSDAVDVIVPLHVESGATRRSIRPVWFRADAARRGETAAMLLEG